MPRTSLVVGFMALLASTGCGPVTAPVSGTVSFENVAIERGTISFEPEDGVGPSTQGIIKDGAYSLHGELSPTLGKKIVRITGVRKTGKQIEIGPGQFIDDFRQFLPAKYNNQSVLIIDIAAGGTNRHDFKLTGNAE